MAEQEGDGLPRAEPQECRGEAERLLGMGDVDVDAPRALAFALLAIAGELHLIRQHLQRASRRSR